MLILKLIPNWRKAWRMFSMQVSALGAAAVGSWGLMPPEWQAQIPTEYVRWAAGLSFVFIMLGRVIAQPVVQPAPPTPPDEAPK